MPRPPKKQDDKAKVPLPVPMGAPPPINMMAPAIPQGVIPPPMPMGLAQGPNGHVVNNEHFLRVRDSAVSRLTAMTNMLQSFTHDYVRQTNLLLGEPTAENGHADILANFDNAAAQLILPVPEVGPPVEEKKERKKRTHDPNAPKRPLTPYFLYMQHARSIIANDLGAEAPKGAVQEEGQRRWAHMSPSEKQGWNNAYQYNLRLYNARVHSYKAGNLIAKNMTDEEALKYAEDYSVPMPEIKDAAAAHNDAAANDHDAIAQQLQQVAAADDSKTPKKAAPKKRKSTAATPAAPPAVPDIEPKATPASPDKKRRRTSTKVAAAPENTEEPKKSGRKKTKSS